MTTPATLSRALAYLAITGKTDGLHINTRCAMTSELVAFVEYEVNFSSGPITLHRRELTVAGWEIAKTSKLWKMHEALTAQGFRVVTRSRQTPRFISYDHEEERNRGDKRSAFISTDSAYAQPSKDAIPDDGAPAWQHRRVA